MESAQPTPPDALALLVLDGLMDLERSVDGALDRHGRDAILGPRFSTFLAGDRARHTPAFIRLGFLKDAVTVVYVAAQADGVITPNEKALIGPLVARIARRMARLLPTYRQFEKADPNEIEKFFSHHQSEQTLFGGKDLSTSWVGYELCDRLAGTTGDESVRSNYEQLMLRVFDEITRIDGQNESVQLRRMTLLAEIRERGRYQRANRDDRVDAFLADKGPEVFHAVANAHEVHTRDEVDVESIHEDARRAFSRTLDSTGDTQSHGRVLLVLGDGGSGKTHLMRTFRAMTHENGRGYAGYMQMSSSTDNYARYVLRNLLDSLEQPYAKELSPESGLIRLSSALVESGAIPPDKLQSLREADLDPEALGMLVAESADRFVGRPGLEHVDVDLLRAFLYLQRSDAAIKQRVLKYLRCEDMSPYDRRMLFEITPRTDGEDPLRVIQGIGQVIRATHDGALVLMIDQLEDVFVVEDAEDRFRRALFAVRNIIEHVPNVLVVVACLDDYYSQMKPLVARSLLDRLEHDPAPTRLRAALEPHEIEALIRQRLKVLFERQDVQVRETEPLFPFTHDDVSRLSHLRTRDVLNWCRGFQDMCRAAGRLVDKPDSVTDKPEVVEGTSVSMEQVWNDFVTDFDTSTPDDEEAQAALLRYAAECFRLPAEQSGRMVTIDKGLLVGVCNKRPHGGALAKEIDEVLDQAQGRIAVLVRSTEFPSRPGSAIYEKLGAVVAAGGRRAVMEAADWRVVQAFQSFSASHQARPGFYAWIKARHPIRRVETLRTIFELPTAAQADEPEPPAAAEEPSPPPPEPAMPWGPTTRAVSAARGAASSKVPTTAPYPQEPDPLKMTAGGLVLGRTRALSSEAVTIELHDLKRHAAFMGSTGSGKTTLALNLLEQLAMRGIPVLLLDRKGDLATYADDGFWLHSAGSPTADARKATLRERLDVSVFTPGEPGGRALALPIIPSGLRDAPAHERPNIARHAAAALGAMMNYKNSQRDKTYLAILGRAILLMGEMSDTPETVGLNEVIEFIADEDPNLVNAVGHLDPRHFQKLVEHLETLRLQAGPLLEAREGERLDAAKLLGLTGERDAGGRTPFTIVSTKFLPDNDAIEFWVSRLLVEIVRAVSHRPSDSLQSVLFLDEADLYLPANRKPATKEPILDLLRRGRSAGLGVFLASQSPGDFDYKARDQVRTWFVGRVAEKTAVDKMKPLLNEARSNVSAKLATAGTGEFFQLADGDVTLFDAQRSVMNTRQVSDAEIRALASRSKDR